MTLTTIGRLNQGWGVCGFTSSLYGLWDLLDKTKRSQLMGGTKAHRLLAEIKTYLTMLEADGNTKLRNDIETYCRVFAEPDNSFGSFTILDYIRRVNESVHKTENQIKSDQNFGIGMPPHAVVDYLQRMWECKASELLIPDYYGPHNGIIGVKNVKKPLSPMYGGLEHWMYRHSGKIYSWGMQFDSVDEAAKTGTDGAKWQICCLITLG